MPLYLDDKKTTLFKGDYKPVNLYLGDKKVTGYEYENASGNHVSFEGTYNDTASVVINGKSEQTQTVQGKNIADIKTLDSFKNGIFWYDTARTVSLTISGSTIHYDYDTSDLSNFIRAKITNLQANAQYTVSCKISPFTGVIRSLFGIFNVSYNSLVNGVFKTTFTTDGNGEHLMGYGAGTDGMILHIQKTHTNQNINITSSVTISEIQLELGSTATPYEPFVPDSPSPDYPSPINSVEPFDLVSCGVNLWKNPGNKTLSGVTLTNNGDGSITLNGTCTASANFDLFRQHLAEGVYTLYAGNAVASPDTSDRAMIQIYSPGTNSILQIAANNSVGTKIARTLQTATDYSFRVRIQTGVTYNNFILKAMLLKGDFTQSPLPNYQSYQGAFTTITSTLRSLPDGTRDYIEIDNVAKTAKLYKDVDNLIFTAVDAYYIYANGTNNNYTTFYRFITGSKTGVQNSICSHFPRVNFGWDNPTSERFSDHYSTIAKYFSIKNTTIGVLGTDDNETRIAKWKNWLSTNPVIIQYQLATPTTTELDYNAVKTYYPYTQIYTTADIQPTLEGKFRIIGN